MTFYNLIKFVYVRYIWRGLCDVILFWTEMKLSELQWSSWGQKYHAL
jgi:hypothetical protein